MVRSAGWDQMGLFTAARRWQDVILVLPGLLSGVTLPVLANLWAEGRQAQYRRVLIVNSIVLTAAAVVVALPVAVASGYIQKAYGSEYAGVVPVLLLTCAVAVLYAANIVVGQAIWATGASRAGVLLAAARAAVLVGAFLLLVKHGAAGLALANVIAYVALTAIQTPLVVASLRRGRGPAGADGLMIPGESGRVQ